MPSFKMIMTFVCEIVLLIELKYSMIMDFQLLCHEFDTKLQEILKGDSPPRVAIVYRKCEQNLGVGCVYAIWERVSHEKTMRSDKMWCRWLRGNVNVRRQVDIIPEIALRNMSFNWEGCGY